MMKRRWVFITTLALIALVVTAGVVVARGPGSPSSAPLVQSALGTGFTYQGRLDEGGSPADGAFDLRFVLFDSDVGGAQVGGIVALEDVAVANGLFTTRLDFGDGIFTGDARWVEVAVRPGASTVAHTTMSPRQPLTPTPYALALPGFYTQPNVVSPNIVGGFSGNVIASGAVGATVSGGGTDAVPNRVSGSFATVGGGKGNEALAEVATIGGGGAVAVDLGPVVLTFNGNRVFDLGGTVGGGSGNLAGSDNGDTQDARFSTVGGGSNNTASARAATVGGGEGNTAAFPFATVSGGLNNSAVIEATVGGGVNNRADDGSATVGGGRNNVASGERSTVGGGFFNTASNVDDTVGGGQGNVSSGGWSTVGGGLLNQANGTRATIPGGDRNTADGHYSFAAGSRANADHQGSFVWADSNDLDFNSTTTNEFAVRATGGVRFVTGIDGITGAPTTGVRIAPNGNVGIGITNPRVPLDIAATGIDRVSLLVEGATQFNNNIHGGTNNLLNLISTLPNQVNESFIAFTTSDGSGQAERVRIAPDGSVGIGTMTPTEQLEITGNFNLPATTATEGIIKSGGDLFIHSFGTNNFFAGRNAGNLTMIGGGVAKANTGVGVNALTSNTEGDFNTAVGSLALSSNTEGFDNAAVGADALRENTTGELNTAVGSQALRDNTTGSSNTAVGEAALTFNTTGNSNTALGWAALTSNTEGDRNTAVGQNALSANTTGTENTALGASALGSNTTGARNTAVGRVALFSNTTGAENTANGEDALSSNTTGDFNTAVGRLALGSNSTGARNTAVGRLALFFNSGGIANTALGEGALDRNTTGNQNTAVGESALVLNTIGSGNTALGSLAGPVGADDLSNTTAIGAGATVNASNKIRLGNSSVTVIEGQVSFTASSDANLKENFLAVDGEGVLEKIRDFNLQSWNFKGHDPSQFRHYGPTAQEFYAAFGKDDIGAIGTDTTINSGDMDGILMTAIQALEERTADLEALSAKNEEQQREIEQLKAQVDGQTSLAENAPTSGNRVVVLASGVAGGFLVLALIVGWYVLVRSGRTRTSRRDTA